MSQLHIGDRVYRVRHINRIGTIKSFSTTFVGSGRRKKCIHFANVVITTGRGPRRATWKLRECRLAE
ncbi:MAG: hypothetical protein HY976_04095 [Candidatus Kerfeldbacteria bacterium]|nr:hypothetical protein [Candidatus Kerfeldbacteria bacterium]